MPSVLKSFSILKVVYCVQDFRLPKICVLALTSSSIDVSKLQIGAKIMYCILVFIEKCDSCCFYAITHP